jgi:hypothetical protein
MTLIEVIDSARALLNEPLDSTRAFPDNTSSFWTDSVLTTYHNIVQQEVANEVIQVFEDYFLTSTNLGVSSGQAEYVLPSNFIKARRLEDIRQPEPTEIYPVRWSDKRIETPHYSVQSSTYLGAGGYYLRGNTLVLTNTPTYTDSSAIRLYYIKSVPDVTAGSLSSEIPIEHHKALVWGIVKYCLFQQQGDTTVANAEYQTHVNKIRSQAETRQVQRSRSVVRTRGDS